MKSSDLSVLFGRLEIVKRCVIPELHSGYVILKDPVTQEFLIGPNGDDFLSMLLRCSVEPDELLGAASFEGCSTIALCVRCKDVLRIYFRGHTTWDSQGELALWDERKRLLRIELVDRTVDSKWSFAGIGMRIVYEAYSGKEHVIVYDNSLRPILEEFN